MTVCKSALTAVSAAMRALATPAMAQEPQDGGTLDVVVQPEPPGLMIGLI